jgi:hypothetical protein
MPLDDEKYRDILTMVGELRRELQIFKEERVKTLIDVEHRLSTQILTYWQATAAALRQLSNWQATNEDKADKERTVERWIQRGGMVVIILLVLLDIYLRLQGG